MNQAGSPLSDPQWKPLQCPHCLKQLFEPVMCGPILVNRLDPKEFQFVTGQAFRCFYCQKHFNQTAAAEGIQEISGP